MLEFQHIVRVNEPRADTLIITRSQLWQGLVLRAHSPGKFNGALLCESTDIVSNRFLRKITAGAAVFTEQVILHPESKIETITLPHNNQLVAESSTLIEEPEPESLFVRFNYRRDLDTSTDSVNVAEYLKAAYVQLDREAIVLIRSIAQSEIDNATIN